MIVVQNWKLNFNFAKADTRLVETHFGVSTNYNHYRLGQNTAVKIQYKTPRKPAVTVLFDRPNKKKDLFWYAPPKVRHFWRCISFSEVFLFLQPIFIYNCKVFYRLYVFFQWKAWNANMLTVYRIWHTKPLPRIVILNKGIKTASFHIGLQQNRTVFKVVSVNFKYTDMISICGGVE